MAEKTLLEIFSKYEPGAAEKAVLQEASEVGVRVDKVLRAVEIRASFPAPVKKERLYFIEDEIKKVYDLNSVRIYPSYPSDFFTEAYIPELLIEAERSCVVARGFFSVYRATLEDHTLTFELPYTANSLTLLDLGKTPEDMAAIIRREFGIRCRVLFRYSEAVAADYTFDSSAELNELDRLLAQSRDEYETALRNPPATVKTPATEPTGERRMSLLGDVGNAEIRDGVCRVGRLAFDVSKPDVRFGSPFEIKPSPIARLQNPTRNVVIVGEMFDFAADASRTGDKFNATFYLTDGHSSITVKKFSLTAEETKELEGLAKAGSGLALRGYTKHDTRKDGPDVDLTFYFSDLAVVPVIRRTDNAPKKRVELHLHTTMSTMDALIPPDVAVATAHAWGHPAVAITDHGNVQGYQDAMVASEKIGQKVIYGIEAYFVNDRAGVLYGDYQGGFEDEFVVFDIETTGLSSQTCGITEIGAVKIKNGQITDRFNTFVNPEMPIPDEIAKLTSITDDMVKDAPVIVEVLPQFLTFAGNRLLIAHNADFDVGFIRAAAERLQIPFNAPYLDTVALSRHLNPELKNHKLDTLSDYFGLGDFHHHRACDDAEMLALIFAKMTDKMKKLEIHGFEDLQRDMQSTTDVLRLPPYHQIILIQNETGRKNLYRLVSRSYLNHFRRFPRIPRTELEKYREGLLIGSACVDGELMRAILDNRSEADIEEIAKFYDYLEIQPISNNHFLIDEGRIANEEGLRDLNRRIVALGEKLHIPVVATCDAHYVEDDDDLYRRIMVSVKFKDEDRTSHLYYRTTNEMLAEFAYLGEQKAYEVVVENTNEIADRISADVRPFPKGTFTPHMDGAEEDLQRICRERAVALYGDPLPDIVKDRLDKELTSIIQHGFAVLYMIAQKLVKYSEDQGYLVGSRGSVGSSFVAFVAGISEVNPLPPHYHCPKCRHTEFITDHTYGSGFDMPSKICPVCGEPMQSDGHDIPFETFLGFKGDKSPDIDLNFSGEVQGRVHKYTEELFGAENVFRAGTIGTLAIKTAFGFVKKYLEEKGISLPKAEVNRLAYHCVGVKRTTGQHPGGIVVVPKDREIYEFCPVQHPADDPDSNIVTTHFTFEYLHDTLLKLDELGHDIPTKYKWLERFSDTSVLDVPMNDKQIYELFKSTKPLGIEPAEIGGCQLGTWGLPELGTRFIQQVLADAKPKNFADLLQIEGLTHGTAVWLGNADELIRNGTCDISQVIGCRDSIMLDLIRYGLDRSDAFKIMESVRKGKGLTPEWETKMLEHGVPAWYLSSCKKIKYMFPKAHAAAYAMSAIRLGWYKINLPLVFYATMFTVAGDGLDANVILRGKRAVDARIVEIDKAGKEAAPIELASIPMLQLVQESMARGIRYLPVDLEKSEAHAFVPEGNAIRLPFSSLPGLGENAAASIVAARELEPFFSVEDLQIRAGLNKNVMEVLRAARVFEGIQETDQLSMF